jgi:hypothetical protein
MTGNMLGRFRIPWHEGRSGLGLENTGRRVSRSVSNSRTAPETRRSSNRAALRMARPGLEPGTPRFSSWSPATQVRAICREFLWFRPGRPCPGFPGLSARLPGVTADDGSRRPFRGDGKAPVPNYRGPSAAPGITGRSVAVHSVLKSPLSHHGRAPRFAEAGGSNLTSRC